MNCPYCKGETSDELSFCSKCGRSIKRENQKEEPHHRALVSILAVFLCAIIGFGVMFINRIDGKNRRIKEIAMSEETMDSDSGQTTAPTQNEDSTESQEPKENKLYSIVENPQYESLYVQKYGLTLEYPMHYIKSDSENAYSVLSLKDPNEAAILEFFACDTDVPIQQFADMLTEKYGENAKLLDENYTEDAFYKKYRINNTDLIMSGKSNNKCICFYSFAFAQFEEHVYQKYYEYIDSHFIFNAEE